MCEEKTTKKEVYTGITSEEIKALFFDKEALQEPEYRLYQLNQSDYRYYYRFVGGEIRFYLSVTTMLGQVMPTSPHLIEWMLANGKEDATEKRDSAAQYGTFMHACFEKLAIERTFDLDEVHGQLIDYMNENNISERYFNEWLLRIRKDVLAFAQFMQDFKVVPLAIEIGLCSEAGFAGCVDMPCLMTIGEETFPAIVDFKSGRKGFWESHEIQLHLYKMMWNENFPDRQIERVFNFSPKDWRKKPTYNLKEQTDAESAKKIPYLLDLAKLADESRDRDFCVVAGIVNLDSDLSNNYRTLSLSEILKENSEQKTPEISEKCPEFKSKTLDGVNISTLKEESEKEAKINDSLFNDLEF